ncbi:hypothetical protein BU17DRAFT_68144 [Hysterangium stoloniferum]|nr:hypothetical protein BU17DRAFT_68144 [Hysterangium stoloniferum]
MPIGDAVLMGDVALTGEVASLLPLAALSRLAKPGPLTGEPRGEGEDVREAVSGLGLGLGRLLGTMAELGSDFGAGSNERGVGVGDVRALEDAGVDSAADADFGRPNAARGEYVLRPGLEGGCRDEEVGPKDGEVGARDGEAGDRAGVKGVEVEDAVRVESALEADAFASGFGVALDNLANLCLGGLGGGGVGGLGSTTGKTTPKDLVPVLSGLLLLTLAPPLTLLTLGESLPLFPLAPAPILRLATASLSTSSLTPPLRNPDPLSWDARWRSVFGGVS